jgi:hypothetical protein
MPPLIIATVGVDSGGDTLLPKEEGDESVSLNPSTLGEAVT